MAVDADTLARARRGDPDARRVIVGAHAAEVVAIVGDAASAEAVLAAVVADLPRYQLGVERLPAWIRTRAQSARVRASGPGPRASGAPEIRPPDDHEVAAMIDRVASAPMAVEPPRPRMRLGVAAAVVGAAAIVAIIIALTRTPAPSGPREGTVVATARRQVRMANGTAVVEAGATMAWKGGAIDQRAGTVYYRIDRPVTITTPHGAIRAAHASGRVAIGATTVVTIDEGDAVVGSAAVTAGGRAELP